MSFEMLMDFAPDLPVGEDLLALHGTFRLDLRRGRLPEPGRIA